VKPLFQTMEEPSNCFARVEEIEREGRLGLRRRAQEYRTIIARLVGSEY
jgi:hypothetical protein